MERGDALGVVSPSGEHRIGEEPKSHDRATDDRRQPGRHVGIGEAHVGRLDVGHHPQHRMARLGPERGLSCRKREQHRPECKQIAAGVEWLPEGLLRRHVVGRAGKQAGDGEAGVVGGSRQAEVGDPDAFDAVFEENVRRLHVAVDEPLGMRGREAPRRLQADAEDLAETHRARIADALLERCAPAVGHDEVGKAGELVDTVNGDDVVVDDRRGGLRLAEEALPGGAARGEVGAEELDRYEAVEGPVVPLEHDSHPAGADDPGDLVGPEAAEHPVVVARREDLLDQRRQRRDRRDGILPVGFRASRELLADRRPALGRGREGVESVAASSAAAEVGFEGALAIGGEGARDERFERGVVGTRRRECGVVGIHGAPPSCSPGVDGSIDHSASSVRIRSTSFRIVRAFAA